MKITVTARAEKHLQDLSFLKDLFLLFCVDECFACMCVYKCQDSPNINLAKKEKNERREKDNVFHSNSIYSSGIRNQLNQIYIKCTMLYN